MDRNLKLLLVRKLIRKEGAEGFSLIELVFVIAVLAILSAFGVPYFLDFINEAIFSATKASLTQSYTSCQTKPDQAPKGPPIPGVVFQSSNCASAISATINGQCTISINMSTGSRSDWPDSYKFCSNQRIAFRENIQSKTFYINDTYIERNCSAYAWVEGRDWLDAQSNAQKLGGNLATINDEQENKFLMEIFNEKAEENIAVDQFGHMHLHIGLTKTVEHDKESKYGHGWVSGESSSYRPDSWGVCNSEVCGMGTDPDGNFTSMILNVDDQEKSNHWNDATLGQTTGSGVGLAEIPIPSCKK